MGRSDAVQVTLEFVAEWRRLGARVTFEPGWETRGNGMTANFEGPEVHHTGFGSSPTNVFPAKNMLIGGRPDLRGPLCNSAGPYCTENDPWIHVIAAHPANHAGASGGRNTAPYPVTGLFNKLVWGHEIDYGGNVPMSAGQRKAALIMARGVINVLRKDPSWVKAHAETSVTGKWDAGYAPGRTIDMAAFRSDVAALTEGDDLMAGITEDRFKQLVIEAIIGGPGIPLVHNFRLGRGEYLGTTLGALEGRLATGEIQVAAAGMAELRAEVAALRAGEGIDVDELAQRISEQTAARILATLLDEIESTVREVMGEDNTEQADELITRLGARLQAVAPAG